MKIALVTDRYITGGGLHHIYRLIEALPEFQFGLFAKAGPNPPQPAVYPNLKLIADNYAPDTIAGWQPDLIHFHHLRPLMRWSVVPRSRAAAPRLFTVHGVHLRQYDFRKGAGERAKRAIRRRVEAYAYQKTDHLIVLSASDREYVAANYAVPPEKMSVIPNGIKIPGEPDEIWEDKGKLKEMLGLDKESFHFLVVSRFHFQKGYDLLLKAVAAFKEKWAKQSVVFLLAGDGPEKPEMERLAAEWGIQPFVRFLGNRSDVDCLMRAADCLLLPSRWEGCPLVIFEAGIAGLPVAAADSPGVRDWIEPGKSGYLFNPYSREDFGEKLLNIVKNRIKLSKLVSAWRNEIVKQYNWEKLVQQYAALYKSMSVR